MGDNQNPRIQHAVARVVWMIIGPMLLVIMTYAVIKTGNGWLTGADAGFLASLAAILFARWLEFRGGDPRTAEGEPATRRHLKHYVIAVVVIGLGVWILANVVGNYVLS